VIFENKGIWGNAIHFMDFDKRRVTGHSPKIPKVGDFLDYKMRSGRTHRFKFESVDQQRDPPDMFFATVSDIGYVDELKEEENGN
jgi:hypothetical protein